MSGMPEAEPVAHSELWSERPCRDGNGAKPAPSRIG
jgi:hypothetical protein